MSKNFLEIDNVTFTASAKNKVNNVSLHIENKGDIPEEFHKAIGNRIYGCDDCQMVCPWNKFAQDSKVTDFLPRNQFDEPDLYELNSWDEETFLNKTAGSPIRRIGFKAWKRNLSIAINNQEN